jgi:catechol 2,3-dioxygenase-like lactoylglutathione lyase family enzyme
MGPSTVQSLAILWLLSENTERTEFYREVPGLPLVEERDTGSAEKHYAVQMGSLRFIIRYGHDVPNQQRPAGRDSIELCFTVTDMERFLQHVREMKLAPLHPPTPFRRTVFTTLRDPDGRLVQIMAPWKE